ncbi:hypothetical protein [Slackia heliotrinireducens]|uniref:hypothetical protein n=1 Tax=Slackia heliotrinireducens TaxID=84110 RepID=UPI0033158EF0
MYTIDQIVTATQTNSTAISIACILVWLVGFLQYGSSVYLQLSEKRSAWWFWQHAWYIGHDFTFVMFFQKWFFIIDFWTFKVMWAGCLIFIGIELFTLYNVIKDDGERQEVFGRYKTGKGSISKQEAWVRGLIGYAFGIVLFYTLTVALGDPCCFFLTMSTNFIVAIFPAFLAEERGSRRGHSMWLGIFILAGTINTFCPVTNMWYNLAPCFQEPWYYVLGVIAIIGCINYFRVLASLPKKDYLTASGKKPLW